MYKLPLSTTKDKQDFNKRLFCLLCRYDTLNGPGYQASLTDAAFAWSVKHLNVKTECFASPLNCYLPSCYGSAYPDVDAVFGSQGRFFEWELWEGAFEVHPPFQEEVLAATALRIDYLLTRAEQVDKSLCFLVIMPYWVDTPAYDTFKQSPLMRVAIHLEAHGHSFRDGQQQRSNTTYRLALHPSQIFILQTSAHKQQWPCTPERIQVTFYHREIRTDISYAVQQNIYMKW